MSANTNAIYPAAPLTGSTVPDANTARDGSGSLTELIAGQTNGARVDRVIVKPLGTTHANVLRFWINGNLVQETSIAAATPLAAAVTASKEVVHLGPDGKPDGEPLFLLGPGDALNVTLHVTDPVQVTAIGGVY